LFKKQALQIGQYTTRLNQ